MEKQVFASPDGAPAVGPYSPAVGAGDFVFVSGQIALDTGGKIVGYTPKDQARKALENLRATLEAAGLGLENVVKTTIFLSDMDEFARRQRGVRRVLRRAVPGALHGRGGAPPQGAPRRDRGRGVPWMTPALAA